MLLTPKELYAKLNPAQLRRDIDETLEALWRLAERPGVRESTDELSPKLAACG